MTTATRTLKQLNFDSSSSKHTSSCVFFYLRWVKLPLNTVRACHIPTTSMRRRDSERTKQKGFQFRGGCWVLPLSFINAASQTAGNVFCARRFWSSQLFVFNLSYASSPSRLIVTLPVRSAAAESNLCLLRCETRQEQQTAQNSRVPWRGCLHFLIISVTHVQLKRTPFGYLFSSKGTQREGKKP